VRESQRVERGSLAGIISEASDRIKQLRDEARPLQKQQLQLEAEVGPIKYIAALFYEDTNKSVLEEAVRWVIITIIFVFDPLAVLLIICANMTLSRPKKIKTAVNVADNWNDIEVETDEEEIIIPVDDPVNTVDIVEMDLKNEVDFESETTLDKFIDEETDDKKLWIREQRLKQNEQAIRQQGTFGRNKKSETD